MIGRVFAASLTIAFGVGLWSGSTGALAKSAGFSGKASGLSLKASGLRQGRFFYRGPSQPSVFLPPIVPPFSVQNASVAPTRPLRAYRRAYGFDLPAAGIGVYYGPDLIAPEFPALVSPSPTMRAAALRSRCGSEVHIVPSEEGGERSVRVTRC